MKPAGWAPEWLASARCRIEEPQIWRAVETQYASSTTLLVDGYDEHDLLERLLEGSKPPLPPVQGPSQHFLLTTPFRYAPVHDSRFRRAGRHGVWYGAAAVEAACAEVAYWRTRFIRDSEGLNVRRIMTHHTVFAAAVSGLGIDLMAPPWVACRDSWTSNEYQETLRLAEAAEPADIEVIRYESVRAPGFASLAVFTPDALREPAGGLDATRQRWVCTATHDHVMMMSEKNDALRYEWVW